MMINSSCLETSSSWWDLHFVWTFHANGYDSR
jgi:hypothetical protein